MSHKNGGYYPPQTPSSGWDQPRYSGPPQHQRPQFAPQNQNVPYRNQNLGPPQGPQFGFQNQGPACAQTSSFSPQNPGNFCSTQQQRHPFPLQNHQYNHVPPQNQGQQFSSQNHSPMCPPHNQGSHFPSQGPRMNDPRPALTPPQPHYSPQNQGPRFQPQNPGPGFPPQNHGPPFPPRIQGPQFLAHSPNPRPSHNQRPFLPPQSPQCPPQNHGPNYQGPPLNQGVPFPVQNQGPMGPPLNQRPQFPPQIQIPQSPCCCPLKHTLSPQGPPVNPGPSYQNQGSLAHTQNQGPPCPVPSPVLRPPLPPLNQHPMCPPQNQRPLCPPQDPPFFSRQNQRPQFSPSNQGPRFPPNRPFHDPQNQGPVFPHPQGAQQSDDCYDSQYEVDDWNNQHGEYEEDSNKNEEYEDDWSKQNEEYKDGWVIKNEDCEEWSNQNDNYKDNWSIQHYNHNRKNDFKGGVPSKRGHGKGFIDIDYKEPPLKKIRVTPNKKSYEPSKITTSIKQCSNNIQINFVKLSHLDPDIPLNKKKLDSLLKKSVQSFTFPKKAPLQSSKECNKQENITKSLHSISNINSNENSYKNRDEQSQKKAKNKEVGSRVEEKRTVVKPVGKLCQSISSMKSTEHFSKSMDEQSQVKDKEKGNRVQENKIEDNPMDVSNITIKSNEHSSINRDEQFQIKSKDKEDENRVKKIKIEGKPMDESFKSISSIKSYETLTKKGNEQSQIMRKDKEDKNEVQEIKIESYSMDESAYPMDESAKSIFIMKSNEKSSKKGNEQSQLKPNDKEDEIEVQEIKIEVMPMDKSIKGIFSLKLDENMSKKRGEQSQMKPKDKGGNKVEEKKIEAKRMDSSNIISKQNCPFLNQSTSASFTQSKDQDISEQPIQRKLLGSNECSTQNKQKSSQKVNLVKPEDNSRTPKNISEDLISTIIPVGSTESKLAQKVLTENLFRGEKIDHCVNSVQRDCNIKLNLKNKSGQNQDKSTQDSYKFEEQRRENMPEGSKQETALKQINESCYKPSQQFQNTLTKIAQQINDDDVHPKFKETQTSQTHNNSSKNVEESCLMSNNAQPKEKELEKTRDSLISNVEEYLSSSATLESEKTSRKQDRSSKRCYSQAHDTSIIDVKIDNSGTLGNQKNSPNELVVDECLKTKSGAQNQIEDVMINTVTSKEVKHETDDNTRKEITINTNADIYCDPIKMLEITNESSVKDEETNIDKTVHIKIESDMTTDISTGKTTYSTKEASGDIFSNQTKDKATGVIGTTVKNYTNPSKKTLTSTASDIPYQEDFTPDDESQNSDIQMNYQSLNEDSQNSGLSREGINLLEANLREFDILDEVEGSDGEVDQSTISSEESESEASDQEIKVDEEDIDAMLEEGLDIKKESTDNKVQKRVRHKVLLEEIGHNHFELLPEGWIQVIHNSGMPVYLHQKSRVCSMSRPYFLGPGSLRSHKIPLSAIPCLQYKRALEIEKKYEEDNKAKQAKVSENTAENRPPLLPVISAKIETAEENEAAQSLDPSELREYCNKVFSFKTISIIPFKSWGDRRKYSRITKDLKKQQRPLLPSGTKLFKFPIQNSDGTIAKSKGEWVINPNGKSYVCILHEYVQHALKQHPKYAFTELKNPATPYSATVYIGEMQYGTGIGASKKHAKLEAAKAALEVLIPEMKDKMGNENEFGINTGVPKKPQNYENSIFDQIRIEDPRVAEFCAKTTEPPPYAILTTCLQRNGMGLNEVNVEYNMNSKRHKEDEFKMTVRHHSAVVMCKNKREGKQKASQAILKALHPNIEFFGSLLRMYGNNSIKTVKEKKQEEQEITGLQCKAAVNQPNYAILNKLEAEMRKMAAKKKEQLAKGKFFCHNDLLLPTASTTDLNKIKL